MSLLCICGKYILHKSCNTAVLFLGQIQSFSHRLSFFMSNVYISILTLCTLDLLTHKYSHTLPYPGYIVKKMKILFEDPVRIQKLLNGK